MLTGNCPDDGSAISPQFLLDGVSGVNIQNLNFNGGGATSVIWIQNSPVTAVHGITIQNIDAGNVNAPGSQRFSSIIYVTGLAYVGGGGCGALDSIKVLNSKLHGFNGVTSTDDNGINGAGCNYNVTNVKYSGNEVWNIGGHANAIGGAAANGILANGVQFAELSFNLVHGMGANTTSCGGPAGVWAYQPDSVVIKFNEVYGMQPIPPRPPGACDWVAYDLDAGVTNSVVEYNYAHDNAGDAYSTITTLAQTRFDITSARTMTRSSSRALSWPSLFPRAPRCMSTITLSMKQLARRQPTQSRHATRLAQRIVPGRVLL
jgi:hypothetical protein